jgi:hypothetical protein
MLQGITVVDVIAGSPDEEERAFDKALARAAKRFEHNELVKAVVAHAQKLRKSETHRRSSTSPKQLLERLRRVSSVVEKRLGHEDAEVFAKFLLDLGWTVARAASESPLGGCKVSMEEEQFLYAADRALHSASAPEDA